MPSSMIRRIIPDTGMGAQPDREGSSGPAKSPHTTIRDKGRLIAEMYPVKPG